MECPKCHTVLDDNQKVCPNCNKVLLLECPNCHSLCDSSVCSKCGYTILVKCSKCSKITPFEKKVCSKCDFPLATSLAYQECENDEFASITIKFESLKRIRRLLKSQELYSKFLYKIKNLLNAQLKGLDCKIIQYDDVYVVNFNKELSLATSANKAVRLSLKILNAFTEVNSKVLDELALPLNLNLMITRKTADELQTLSIYENNVKLLTVKKDEKRFLKGFQLVLDQFIRDEVSKDYKTDSLYSMEETGRTLMFYEVKLENYVVPPTVKTDDIVQVTPRQISQKNAKEEDKDLYSFKVFDINAKCKFERTNAVEFWNIFSNIRFDEGGKIVSLRSKEALSVELSELEQYFVKNDIKFVRVCCTEEMSYTPWGFFKAVFADYFQLPLLNDIKVVSKFDEQTLKFHKPLFDLYFNKPVKAMSPEDARFTYMEAWSKFLKILTKTVIIVEGFENIDDTSLQTLELYFDKFTNVKTNFLFITNNEVSVHEKFKGLLRVPNYTEFVLKRSTMDSCLSVLKSDAADFIQSFYYEKLCEMFSGSLLYFQNALKYLMETGVLIEFENKLLVRNKKAVILPKDLKALYKARIKSLSKNMDLSLILAYSTILGPSIDFETLELLGIKDISKNVKVLENMGLVTLNSSRLFINNYNILNTVMKQSLKKDIEQFLAKTIITKIGKNISDTTMVVAMGILEAYKEEYLTLWKNSQFALKTGDFDAYLKSCLGFLSLVELVGANINSDVIEENKKDVYNNILMSLYAYSPTKIYFIENTLLMDAIKENDNDKIVKLSNLMLQGALISSNYTDAQGLLFNILSRMKDPVLLVNGAINTRFLLLALVNIEILYNIGEYRQCIDIANEILSVLTVDIIDKVKPASFSTNLFVSHIMETLRLVALAKIQVLDENFDEFFESIEKALGVELPEKDCILAIKDFLAGKIYSTPNLEKISAFSKIIYLILHEAENLKDNYKQFAQNIYQAKLLASDIHQRELELFCDLLIAFAYSKISATAKAKSIIEDVVSISNRSALFNILAISRYFLSNIHIAQGDYDAATKLINDILAIIRRSDNQAKIIFMLYQKLYINLVELQEKTSVDLDAERRKLSEFSENLKFFYEQ